VVHWASSVKRSEGSFALTVYPDKPPLVEGIPIVNLLTLVYRLRGHLPVSAFFLSLSLLQKKCILLKQSRRVVCWSENLLPLFELLCCWKLSRLACFCDSPKFGFYWGGLDRSEVTGTVEAWESKGLLLGSWDNLGGTRLLCKVVSTSSSIHWLNLTSQYALVDLVRSRLVNIFWPRRELLGPDMIVDPSHWVLKLVVIFGEVQIRILGLEQFSQRWLLLIFKFHLSEI